MLRWLATALIAVLLLLDVALPFTPIGRRGNEAATRSEVAGADAWLGTRLPALALQDLEGAPFSVDALRGHRVLLTFERSVDW